MALHQYTEGLRRGIDHCQRLSSANDGALWIGRITDLNFPQAVQIVDWSHGKGRLWKVKSRLENKLQGKQWVEQQLDHLWNGHVDQVVKTLKGMNLAQCSWPDEVRQAPGYQVQSTPYVL